MIAQRKKLYVFTGLTSVRQIFLRIFILEWTCNIFYLIGQLENVYACLNLLDDGTQKIIRLLGRYSY